MADEATTQTDAAAAEATTATEGAAAEQSQQDAAVDVDAIKAGYEKQIADLRKGYTDITQAVPKEVRETLDRLGDGRDKALALAATLAEAGVDWDAEMAEVKRALAERSATTDMQSDTEEDYGDLPPSVQKLIATQHQSLKALEAEVNSLKSETTSDRTSRSERYLQQQMAALGLPKDGALGKAVSTEAYATLIEKFGDRAWSESEIDAAIGGVKDYAQQLGWSPPTNTTSQADGDDDAVTLGSGDSYAGGEEPDFSDLRQARPAKGIGGHVSEMIDAL